MSKIESKKCYRCNQIKLISEFHKMNTSNDGLRPECKICRKKGTHKEVVRTQNKNYYEKNKTKEDLRCKKYRSQNIEKINAIGRLYQKNNKDKKHLYSKNYVELNRDKVNKRTREYVMNKKKTNMQFKLSLTLRGRTTGAIKRQSGKKSISSMVLIGCTIKDARKHLESQFTEGMTWENHGLHGWHIDHIIPCASFDLTDPEQQKKCFHYTNLQPLWAEDNLKKGAKYE